ncbi:carbamoyl-phosphate synthase large subunit [Verticiella sediminum]|uniref:acetyl-CoA carboxylase n=1 Tax=Verticiella sediminum TaxID=1247510 RepID=A0A556AKL1_9BURK|nr:carboxyl transferase domain-containing protein [Verticiella sediminum]TSH93413.1 carbamoyl-phosphate synthase large subunit [Verticiella sediminum]
MKKLLVANRGEIAVRLIRAARECGLATVAIYAEDDASAPHRQLADEAVALRASGPAAYLDVAAVIEAGRRTGCDAVHPGYGFLSERADFATACAAAGLIFVGPTPEQLELFGDKARALALAVRCQVPVMPATHGDATLEEITRFFDAQDGAGVVIKAVGGGGGRGMRVVGERAALAEAYARCRSEARSAFGVDAVYAERLVVRARHIEVQVVGDGRDALALGERDCSVQRRFQKLIEIAPSPALAPALRTQIVDAALRMARETGYRSLGTFEFLVDEAAAEPTFIFIEANPRLQVEHTITEQVTGVDLVAAQLGIAAGRSLADLGLDVAAQAQPRGYAIQLRINAETLDAKGQAMSAGGRLSRFEMPAGPGVRVDTHGYPGYAPSASYDTLLAKLIVTHPAPDFDAAVRRARRALAEARIAGLGTNLHVLQALVERDDFARQRVHTRYLEGALPEVLARAAALAQAEAAHDLASGRESVEHAAAVPSAPVPQEAIEAGLDAVRAPMAGKIIEVPVAEGAMVRAGQTVLVLEAMKMEAAIAAERDGRVIEVRIAPGEQAGAGQVLVVIEPMALDGVAEDAVEKADPRGVRADLQRLFDREVFLRDESRPEAVAKRHARGQRMARENIADLCDEGSFVEYGALAVASQSSRRTKEDLVRNTPADGIVTGIGTINAALFGREKSQCAVLSYDATVLAGTQGKRNHVKTDRMLEVALHNRLPTILFAEGGGGRPGDVDVKSVAGLIVPTFAAFARLSGEVPVVGIVSGRCFAGNAALLGCSDVIIATRDANIGMAGPAMIEGGGLGRYRPEDIGPADVQYRNGVVDLLVDNEAEAVAQAKHYLSMFQGRVAEWDAPDPYLLRAVVPENRLRVYDTRAAVQGIADVGSVLELRAGFGVGIHTALARIEGRPVGILASNPRHLGGAIDADAADKAARFMQLCDAHGLPIVSLIDTPGFMVGPEHEKLAQVRHVCRMFVVAAKLRVPFLSVVLRKSYGLGAMAMGAGGYREPSLLASWPTGEYGGMGLEGAVRLGFSKELAAAAEGGERDALYQRLVAQMYEQGQALNAAEFLEIDAVIDPAQTRHWLSIGLAAAEPGARHRLAQPASRFVDTW